MGNHTYSTYIMIMTLFCCSVLSFQCSLVRNRRWCTDPSTKRCPRKVIPHSYFALLTTSHVCRGSMRHAWLDVEQRLLNEGVPSCPDDDFRRGVIEYCAILYDYNMPGHICYDPLPVQFVCSYQKAYSNWNIPFVKYICRSDALPVTNPHSIIIWCECDPDDRMTRVFLLNILQIIVVIISILYSPRKAQHVDVFGFKVIMYTYRYFYSNFSVMANTDECKSTEAHTPPGDGSTVYYRTRCSISYHNVRTFVTREPTTSRATRNRLDAAEIDSSCFVSWQVQVICGTSVYYVPIFLEILKFRVRCTDSNQFITYTMFIKLTGRFMPSQALVLLFNRMRRVRNTVVNRRFIIHCK